LKRVASAIRRAIDVRQSVRERILPELRPVMVAKKKIDRLFDKTAGIALVVAFDMRLTKRYGASRRSSMNCGSAL